MDEIYAEIEPKDLKEEIEPKGNLCYEANSFNSHTYSRHFTSHEAKPNCKRFFCLFLCVLVTVFVVAFVGTTTAVWTASKLFQHSNDVLDTTLATHNDLLAYLNRSNGLQKTLRRIEKGLVSLVSYSEICSSTQNQIRRSPTLPASSCLAIYLMHGNSRSGYYWVGSSNGSAVCVYCDMTKSCGGVTGGWRRVASLKFTWTSVPCPVGLRSRRDSGIRTCGINSTTAGCSSVVFHTSGISYSRVCGMVEAYQVGSVDAFGVYGRNYNITIDSNYVDGVSLTHGTSPRTHIWTFAAASNDVKYPQGSCQCVMPNHLNVRQPPPFISDDYFCDSLATEHVRLDDKFYYIDPLWDGAGCSINNTCCSLNNPPWFYKHLPSATTEDIEMRVCSDEGRDNEDIALSQVEIYVQ